MNIRCFVTGAMATNTYVLYNRRGGEAVVIDPGDSGREIETFVRKEGLNTRGILLTHGHVDHIAGVENLRRSLSSPVWIHAGDAAMLGNPELNLSAYLGLPLQAAPADRILSDGDIVTIDNVLLAVRHTPGHTPGGISLVGPDFVITGDTLFAGSVGRTDLPGGDMRVLLESINKQLMVLADYFAVFPGHGPQTVIGRERAQNPFLLQGEGRSPYAE